MNPTKPKKNPGRCAVYLCADNRFMVQALYVATALVRERARGAIDHDVLIIADEAEVEDSHRAWMKAHGIRHVSGVDTAALNHLEVTNERLSKACLVRLLAPDYFKGEYDLLLQLDADLAIRGPVAPLFTLDLGDGGIAAAASGDVPELMASKQHVVHFQERLRKVGMKEPFGYFNVGVMLIDVDWWNRENITRRSLEFLAEHLENCPFPDEFALSALMEGNFERLSPVWNLRSWTTRVPGSQRFVDPAIVHYDGPVKPWKRFGELRPLFGFEREYQEYRAFLEGTPWEGWLDEQWGLSDLVLNLGYYSMAVRYRLLGKSSWAYYAPARRRIMRDAFGRHCREAEFADVAQGLVVRRDGVLRPA